MSSHILWALGLAAAGLHSALLAQPVSNATVADIEKQLAPSAPMTRSMNGTRNLVPEVRSIDLVIQFDSGSARLQDKSKPLLDNLAQAMKGERLKDMKFKVEGHTDAKGNDAYNLKLSQQRAEAVQQFLVHQGVAINRLVASGKGSTHLANASNPLAAENRRVRIVNLD